MFYPVFLKVLNACGLTHFAQEEWNKDREIFCSLYPSSSDYNRFFCNVFLTRPTISFEMFHSVFLNVLNTCELTLFAQEEWKKKSGDIWTLGPSFSDYNRFFCNVFLIKLTIFFEVLHLVFLKCWTHVN